MDPSLKLLVKLGKTRNHVEVATADHNQMNRI